MTAGFDGQRVWVLGKKTGSPTGLRVEHPDGVMTDFNVGERVRCAFVRLPGDATFLIEKIVEGTSLMTPMVVLRFQDQHNMACPFDLRKLTPLEQLGQQAQD